MKITNSVRQAYDAQLEINKLLEVKVKDHFEGAKDADWFYKGRIKELKASL
jgi:hypothetical protein